MPSTITIGDTVTLRGGRSAVILSLEPCGWEKCPFGDECITVQEDRWTISTNARRSEVLAPDLRDDLATEDLVRDSLRSLRGVEDGVHVAELASYLVVGPTDLTEEAHGGASCAAKPSAVNILRCLLTSDKHRCIMGT